MCRIIFVEHGKLYLLPLPLLVCYLIELKFYENQKTTKSHIKIELG